MVHRLIALQPLFDSMPDGDDTLVKMVLADIAAMLTDAVAGYTCRVIWLDDAGFERLLPYLEVWEK